MKSSICLLLTIGLSSVLAGCVEFHSTEPARYCGIPSGMSPIPPPTEEQTLFALARNWKRPDHLDPHLTFDFDAHWNRLPFFRSAWFKSDQGELELCREPLDPEDGCGNQFYTFAKVDSQWVLKRASQTICID